MPPVAAAFLRACALDVAVRKPGNVSAASPGHRMTAPMFIASAAAAAAPLCRPGARVGDRIEAAARASWNAAGCNTNLGIVLLCAPLARALETAPAAADAASLRTAVEAVLADLDAADAAAAYRAIAAANPGGLGAAEAEDVRGVPTVDLRAAMALAADRDLIARQYRNGFADVFRVGAETWPDGLDPRADGVGDAIAPALVDAVQRVHLAFLSRWPDTHIVRKHGERAAQNVLTAAQAFSQRSGAAAALDADPAFVAWDEALKRDGINPGTSADLTVATLMLVGALAGRAGPTPMRRPPAPAGWHGT